MKENRLSSFDKKVLLAVAGFISVVFSLCTFISLSGDIEFSVSEDILIISADYWQDHSISLSDIDTISYKENDIHGKRTYGFGSSRLSMGEFKNNEYDKYLRYSYTKCSTGIAITKKDGSTVVISKSNPQETLDLYNRLIASYPELKG